MPVDEIVRLAAAPQGGGDRRGRARLLLRQQPARGAGRRASATTSRRRRRRGCRSSSTRAMPTTISPRSWRRRWRKGAFPAVLHCFTGGPELARRGLELGLYISFSGILTFKKSDALREIAADVPLDRLLVETDAPYLAPGKYPRQAQRAGLRGGDGQPSWRGSRACPQAELARATTENFFRLYAKTPRTAVRRMSMRFTILGCGSSGGVPRVGNVWGSCDPANPKNRRRRCALLVERFGKGGTTARAGRHPARHARAAARCARRDARRRALHARPCRPHARHRRPARRVLHHAAAHRRLRRCPRRARP